MSKKENLYKWIQFLGKWYYRPFGKQGYSTNILGSKKESYYKTEGEMLFDTEYTYESLSKEEKEIYNQNKYE